MIVEDVENLIHLIDYRSQLQQNFSDRAGFRTRLEELQKNLEELDKRAAVVKAFTDREFAEPDVSTKAFAAFNQVNATLDSFREAPDSIISSNSGALRNTLRSLNSALDQYISDSWHEYTGRDRQVDQQVLDGLGTIPIFAPTVQRVKLLTIRIDNCRRDTPLSEADFTKFDQLVQEAETAWKDLGSTELPEEIEAFLRSAGSREGASLDLLNAPVDEWLTQKGIKDSFRIHMKSLGT